MVRRAGRQKGWFEMAQNVKGGISMVIGMVVLIIIVGAMMPILVDTIDSANATGTVGTLLDYMPLFVILGVVLAVIVLAVSRIGGGAE